MDKTDIICNLKANNYSYEDEGEQVTVKLAIRYFLKLYIENGIIVKNEDRVQRFNLSTNGKSLKTATKMNMIVNLIFISLFAIWFIFDPYFFFSKSGIVLIIGIVSTLLYQLLEFCYYNNRLSKIKKLLNLNDRPAA